MSEPQKEDPTIDKVRDLLFGEQKKQTDSRVAELNKKMEKIQSELMGKINDLKSDLSKAERKLSKQNSDSVSEIGSAIAALGETIKSSAGSK